MQIKVNDRVCILGKTGSGKSVLEKSLLRKLEAHLNVKLVVHDVKQDLLLPGYVLARTPDELTQALTRSRLIHYQPTSLSEEDFDEVCSIVYWHGNIVLIVDELSYYTTAQNIVPFHKEILVRGRTRGVGIIHLSQRPVNIFNAVISEAEHLFVFQLLLRGDIEKIKPVLSKEFIDRVPTLPKYHYIYADTNRNVVLCKPVKFEGN